MKTQNLALKHILLQLTQLMQFLVAENDNQVTQQIYNDFLHATTIREKIWIAEAMQDIIA
jgi:hypothetical protein